MNNARWRLQRDASIGVLNLNHSMLGYFGDGDGFSKLTIDTLNATQSALVLSTDINAADNVGIARQATGSGNLLYVNFLNRPATAQR